MVRYGSLSIETRFELKTDTGRVVFVGCERTDTLGGIGGRIKVFGVRLTRDVGGREDVTQAGGSEGIEKEAMEVAVVLPKRSILLYSLASSLFIEQF